MPKFFNDTKIADKSTHMAFKCISNSKTFDSKNSLRTWYALQIIGHLKTTLQILLENLSN